MTKKRWIQDPKTLELIPAEEYFRNKRKKNRGVTIIPDMQPYKAVCGDMAGKMITGRKAHREFKQRNRLEEVGNEYREFFEHGGKTRDNPFAQRNPDFARIKSELEGRTRRRP